VRVDVGDRKFDPYDATHDEVRTISVVDAGRIHSLWLSRHRGARIRGVR